MVSSNLTALRKAQSNLPNVTNKPAESTVIAVVRALEEDIVLGRLHQRERLIEDDLCKRFEISRHVLRQALSDLERMQLIQRLPNRGASVCSMSVGEVEQLYALRDLLETTAAAQICYPVSSENLEKLRAIQTLHDAAVDSADLAAIFRSNHEFHRILFSLCENRYLSEAIENYAQRAHGVRFLVLNDVMGRQKAREQHHLMIQALTIGDRDQLVGLCRNHLPPSRTAYVAASGIPLDHRHTLPS